MTFAISARCTRRRALVGFSNHPLSWTARSQALPFGNHQISQPCPVTKSKIDQNTLGVDRTGDVHMNSNAVLETVRRYRAIASLYRQTAGFRPVQRASLLSQAREWENLAVEALEVYFADRDLSQERRSTSNSYLWAQSEMHAVAA